MSIYEPKTDSREFEVANSGQGAPAWASASPEPTEISIRLWGVQDGEGNRSLTWTSDSVCVFMIADLVTASGGRLEESGAVMAAHFDNAGQALVAARRIQTSLLEFRSGHPNDTVGAVVLIHSPFGQPGLTADTVRTTLKLAKPGQILLPEPIAKRWADVPGLEFRPVARTSSGGIGQPGLVELLWTSAEELERLQHSVQDGTGAEKGESPPVGATLIVQSPFVGSGRSTSDRSVSPAKTGDYTIEPPHSGEVTGNPLLEELEENPPFWTRTKAIVGVLALVLVAGLIAVVYWPMPESKRPSRVQPESINGGSSPVQPKPVVTPPTAQPQPAHTNPPVETKPVEVEKKVPAPIVTKPQPQKKPAPAPVIPSVKPGPVITPDAPSASLKSDIAQLLRVAQTSLGEGRYDDARAAYRKILQLQPDNQEAKEGLRKIELIKSDSDH